MESIDISLPNKSANKTRELGIEILRIIAMFLIVCQHFMNHGGFLKNAGETPFFLYLLNVAFSPSVNVFVLITGYFSVNSRKFRVSKCLTLWCQVLFYSLLMLFVTAAFGTSVSDITVYRSFSPVINKQYWFFSAYLLLVLLTPYLSAMVNSISKREHLALVIGTFVAGYLSTRFDIKSVFSFNYGYSILWFCLLFIVGAYLRKYPVKVNKYIISSVYLVCIATLLLFKYKFNDTSNLIYKLIYNSTDYNQPLVLMAAICLFLLFLGIKNKENKWNKIITHVSSCTFGVYLFHETPVFRQTLYNVIFKTSEYFGSSIAVLYVLLFATLTFAVGCVVDSVRQILFSLVKKGIKAIRSKNQ